MQYVDVRVDPHPAHPEILTQIMRLKKMNNGNGPANARTEILLLRQLRHRNVIRLHEVLYKPEKEKVYLVMEYCAGNLNDALEVQPDKRFALYVAVPVSCPLILVDRLQVARRSPMD